MKLDEYVKLLKYFDRILWDRKSTETGWNYNGLMLDAYFDMSILSIDYLDIEDYFDSYSNFKFNEIEYLYDQFKDINEDKRIKLIEGILNIFKHSTYNKEFSDSIFEKSIRFLKRNDIEVNNPPNGLLQLSNDDIIDRGSYCIIKKVKKGILRKELNPIYSNNQDFQRRMKYEFENMYKLRDCPQVLNVFSYDPETFSYLMERADKNLFEYLGKEVDISFEEKMKIIYDVLHGMKYAHENNIIHRDLHLGNVLKLGNDFVLCDFGLSKDESIERSLKSTATVKNNHLFVDPLAIGDFTKLDKKSDIYSLGKLIDYVFTTGSTDIEHLLTFVVEKCTSRNKFKRYDAVDEILNDIEIKLNHRSNDFDKKIVLEKIQNEILDMQVTEFINSLVQADRICDYIVENNLQSFGKVILQFEQVDQIEILQAIDNKYVESTGYGQFQNYDIFTNIAYFICNNIEEGNVYSIAYDILSGCAQYRYSAADYLEIIDKRNL
ncbi:protein kinase [Sporosarcina sp. Marseille-Q4063]|uniref:protein kinase domain-containing protein n=1 Tax=Sporosarcina sp. Marseille-Q4063 TaxID=2810514 RepID=UPI001BAECECA|nr:protein kinase [Sporosarcina sp. Marseille-Q4063]QUW20726.1 protein kinase [Sporosarcina sp. Marseille-Q4063]